MRKLLIGALMLAATTMGPRFAVAQNYPWCLVNNQKGTTSCAFVSREQCQLSTGGNIGYCIANPGTPSPRAPVRGPRRYND